MTNFPTTDDIAQQVREALDRIGVDAGALDGARPVRTPITGGEIGATAEHTADDVTAAIERADAAYREWRDVPAPVRGALVKRWGELLVEHKQDLATIVTAEAGKIPSEAAGEVQEMIDIVDFAVGQSRMLYGKTMPSERPGHKLAETWHPIGVVGIITAFNFPVAVFAWNTALALVAGDTVVWKPAEAVRLSAIATNALLARAVADVDAPADLHHLVLTDRRGAAPIVED
ncbi:MAG: aldehyde dehydrogenase family protein, partial [Microbacteriaceae bacterium]|nr:aldehyde dehydrogenase family protein [Microbacteriaceae bacterium]